MNIKKQITIIILSCLPVLNGFAQAAPDTINRTDEQGRKQGVWKKTYPQNTVHRYEGQFKDDQPYGTFKYYYKDGTLKTIMEYSNSGVLARTVTFWENGRVMSKGNYINQKKDSTWIYYGEKGYLNIAEQYNMGEMNGWRIMYYKVGNNQKKAPVREEAKFVDGKMSGAWKKYFRDGSIKAKGQYENDQKTGTFEYFYPDGSRRRTEMFKNGRKHGFFVYFDDSAKVYKKNFYWKGAKLEEGEQRKKLEKQFNKNHDK